MLRTKIELIKTAVCLALAVLSAVLVVATRQINMSWIVLVLAALTAWFGWKYRYFSTHQDNE